MGHYKSEGVKTYQSPSEDRFEQVCRDQAVPKKSRNSFSFVISLLDLLVSMCYLPPFGFPLYSRFDQRERVTF